MSDPWKDWEDYNHGLQGTPTGSGYNDMGLNDRKSQARSRRSDQPKAKKTRDKKSHEKNVVKNQKVKEKVSADDYHTRRLMFLSGFITAVILLYQHGVRSPEMIFFSGIGAGIALMMLYRAILMLILGAIFAAILIYGLK